MHYNACVDSFFLISKIEKEIENKSTSISNDSACRTKILKQVEDESARRMEHSLPGSRND